MMAASIPHFLQTVDEIEQNSWWESTFGPSLKPMNFTYSCDQTGVESITNVPREALESLLLRVRRLTMNDSSEQLHLIRNVLKQLATHDLDKHLLDVWHSYWRLAFIKEPFEIELSGTRDLMTGYKVYECFINGRYFHTNVSEYNVILYGDRAPIQTARTYLFFQNMFHSVVVNLCLCAIGLHRFIRNGNTFEGIPLDGFATAFGFVPYRNRVGDLDEQYKVFNEWIEKHGGCKNCRWK